MSGPFKENWKRLSNKWPPNNSPSAAEDKDILRVEDMGGIFAASGVVTAVASSGDLLIGGDGVWGVLPSGEEGQVLKIIQGQLAWGVDASGTGGGGSGLGDVVGPAGATDSAIVLYDGTTGKLIKDSTVTISSGNIVTSGNITVNNLTVSNLNLTGTIGDILYATGTDSFGNLGIGSAGEVLTVVGGIPSWAAASGSGGGGGGSPVTTVIATGVGATTIVNADYFAGASGSTTINLPASPVDGQIHVIKDSLGNAGTTPITVDGNGANIDDLATVSLVNNYEAVTLIFSSILGQWQLI